MYTCVPLRTLTVRPVVSGADKGRKRDKSEWCHPGQFRLSGPLG
jgi:hypothetical protein